MIPTTNCSGNLFYFLNIQNIGTRLILVNLCNLTRTHCTTTFTDCETKTWIKSYSIDKFYINLYVITRHNHFYASWERNLTCAVHGTEIELWTILITEWSMTTTFLLLQYIYR